MMRISVLIPTLNPKKEYLQQTLNSIPPSVDEVVLSGAGFDEKDFVFPGNCEVKIFRNGLGLVDAINDAVLDYVTGDYFSILPDDDFFLPEIEQVIQRVHISDADFVHFAMAHYHENERQPGTYCNDPEITFEKNYKRNMVNGSAFVKRSSFVWLEGYKQDVCGDWDFFNRALKSGMYFEHVGVAGIALRFNGHSRIQKMARAAGAENIKKTIQTLTDAWDKQFYFRCAAGM